MTLQDRARFWNTTAEDRAAIYPCDRYLNGSVEGLVRAIHVNAPAEVLFRWLCQLKVAPYSYDWIDNGGRQSPRELTPGLEHLEQGQPFLIFEIVDFEPNRHISLIVRPPYQRLFGPLAISYVLRPQGQRACRLVVKLNVGASTRWERIRRALLAWGDLIMMRKQLVTLKELAEEHAPERPSSVIRE